MVLSHVGFDAGEIKIEQAYYRGMLGTAENETLPQNVIFALPSLPFLAGIGAQIRPKQVLPATRKLLMRAIFPITLKKLGRQKINSPPGTSLKAAQDASSSHIAHPVLTSVTVYWLFSRPGLISAAGLTVILAGGL